MIVFKRLLTAFSTVTPSAVAPYIADWQGLFSGVGLSHRQWDRSAASVALGISIFVSLWMYVWLHDKPKAFIRRIFHVAFGLLMAAIILCFGVQMPFGAATSLPSIAVWNDIWRAVYVAMLILAACTALTFLLVVLSDHKSHT